MVEIIKGEIIGYKQDNDIISEYMSSMINSIKEGKKIIFNFIEIITKFPEELKQYYIYTRFNKKKNELKIFIKLIPKSKVNPRENEIYFLITLNEEYPQKPPILQCLTNVIYYFKYKKISFVFQV